MNTCKTARYYGEGRTKPTRECEHPGFAILEDPDGEVKSPRGGLTITYVVDDDSSLDISIRTGPDFGLSLIHI